MKRLNLKTSTRVALALGAVTLILAALMVASIARMNALAREIDGLAASRVPKIVLSARAVETLLQSSRLMRDSLILDDEAEIRSDIADIRRNVAAVEELEAQIEALVKEETGKNLFRGIVEARTQYEPVEKDFLDRVARGDYSTAKDVMISKLRPLQVKYIDAISSFVEFQTASIESEAKAAHGAQSRSVVVIVILAVVAVLLALLATVAIIRGIARNFGERSYAARVAGAIASGDLTEEVRAGQGDDRAILAAMRRMRDDLARAVGTIRQAAEAVGIASRQIAAGNADLSTRTEEQASSLEETAASMEELATTVRQNADNAVQADKLAHNASRRAEQGGAEVARVVETMGEISESATKISEITSVIDGIAFQTNILALNAAVEAARAGEQGRGFAVVASEVRSLAHRSGEAAKEIKKLIAASVERVGNGRKLVEQAGGTIETLVADVKQVGDLMRSIAEASAEQSRGVQQVNKTVTEMDKVVQQNASAVQESASAAEALRAQAEALLAAVSAFQLAGGGETAAAAAMPAAAPEKIHRLAERDVKSSLALAMAGAAAGARASDEWQQF